MKHDAGGIPVPLRDIDQALQDNPACAMPHQSNRTFLGRGEGSPEIVVIVAAAHPGIIYGHVMFHRKDETWRSFLLHSMVTLVDDHEVESFRDKVVEGLVCSLVYSMRAGQTSSAADTFEDAIRGLCRMIQRYDPSAVWPEQPGPHHRIDFTPFDAYRVVQKLSR